MPGGAFREELFELCDLSLDEDDPVAKAEELFAQQEQQEQQPAGPDETWAQGFGPLNRTPLHALCSNSECEPAVGEAMARLLLVNGAPVDQRDLCGDTALHVLCSSDHTAACAAALAHALLDGGAACTLEDAAGRTPCSLAEGHTVSGGGPRDVDGDSGGSDEEDSGPVQLELADLLRRRMILANLGVGHRVVSSGAGAGEPGVVVAGDGAICWPEATPAIAAAPEPEPEPGPPLVRLTVLVVGPGSAMRSDPERFAALQSQHTLECPEVPEPEDDLEGCVQAVVECMGRCQPDLLLCGSRGAIALAALISRGLWAGPSLLLSGVKTIDCICAWRDGNVEYFGTPLTLYHGTEDESTRVALVREEAAAAAGAVQLLEARGEGHSLPSLSHSSGGPLIRLVAAAYHWGADTEGRAVAAAAVGPEASEAAGQRLAGRFRQKDQMSAFVDKVTGGGGEGSDSDSDFEQDFGSD